MHNILYLSYDGMSDPLGQSQVIPYLQGLSKYGYQIHLVSFEKKENQDKIQVIAELLQNSGIIWHPLSYTKNPPVISSLKDILVLGNLTFRLHRKHNFSIVHCRSYIPALVGEFLKKKFKIKFIFDMRGFWADERVDGKIWNLKNPIFALIYRYFKRKEQHLLKNSDYTVCLTHKAKTIIQSWDRASQYAPIEVIPCCVDTDLFDFNSVEPKNVPFKKNEAEFVLCYLGAIGTWYMLDEMLVFFSKLLAHLPHSRFLFVTQESPEMILAKAKKNRISVEKISIFKAQREQVPVFLSQADAAIFFIMPTFSKMASSPTKQGEMMAMGLPVICNSGVGDTDFVIENYQCGLVIKELNGFEDWGKIEELKSISKTKIREAAIDFYALDKGIERYRQLYQKLLIQT